jgi:hypothetical protein
VKEGGFQNDCLRQSDCSSTQPPSRQPGSSIAVERGLRWSHWFIGACRTGGVGFRTTACGSLIVLQRTPPVRQAVTADASIGKGVPTFMRIKV